MTILAIIAVALSAFTAGVYFQKTRQLEAIVTDLMRSNGTSANADQELEYDEELDLHPDRVG